MDTFLGHQFARKAVDGLDLITISRLVIKPFQKGVITIDHPNNVLHRHLIIVFQNTAHPGSRVVTKSTNSDPLAG